MILCKSTLILMSTLFLTSCHLGPDYEPPIVETPSQWKAPIGDSPNPQVDYWWEVFEDKTLDCLEATLLAHNPNLTVALERFVKARANAGVYFSDLFPQLKVGAKYNNTISLNQIIIPGTSGQPQSCTAGEPPSSRTLRMHQQSYHLPFDLNYQLDLWGYYRGQFNSARYTAEAQAEVYNLAILTLTSDLASAYFRLRALDAQIDLLGFTKKVRKDAQEVNQARWQAGLVNYTDVTRAALEYTNAEAKLYESIRLRSIQENQIAVLIGIAPSVFHLPHQALIHEPPNVPVGLPSAILLRRPDIAEAERQLAAAHALIGVAYAAFFPQISLTGVLGFSSPSLQEFLTSKSRFWEYGFGIAQSLFDAGRNLSNLDLNWAHFRETLAAYQNQVLTAFQEVEDALSNIELQALQYASLEKSVESGKLTSHLSTDRYKRGLVNYLDVVDSQRAELEVEISAINLMGMRYLSLIQLIKAIGGTFGETYLCDNP